MLDITPIRRAAIARYVDATFPTYKGRKFSLRVAKSVTLHDLNWSGGSRNEYRACALDGRAAGTSERYAAMAPWENPAEGCELPIQPGFVVLCRSVFQGRESGIMLYAHPDDVAHILPNPLAA
jgi:hypothetical protein